LERLEPAVTRSLAARSCADLLVNATRIGDAVEAAEPVGDDPGTALNNPACDLLDVLLREPPHAPQLYTMGLAGRSGLDCHDERHLAGAATPTFSPAALAAPVGVVHLATAADPLALLAVTSSPAA